MVLAAVLAAVGCTGTARDNAAPPPDSGTAPITNTDPCAMRLHDLSGALLAYYMEYYQFPAKLSELADASVLLPAPPAECPVSKRPYVYNPEGILLPERSSRVLVYDAAPSHSGMRWAITAEERADGGLPVTKVLALPESFFLLHPPE